MLQFDESTVVKDDLIAEIKEETISLKAAEVENRNISKIIVDCQDELQEREYQKAIARSDNKKKLLREMAIYSDEIDLVMTDMAVLKSQNAVFIPILPIRTFIQQYRKLTEDMKNLVLNRSTMSIKERKQEVINNQKKMSRNINDIIQMNQVSRSILKTGNWKNEIQILNSLLQQSRKQGQVIDNKDSLRKKRIQELQKKINTSKNNLNLNIKENSENNDIPETDFSMSHINEWDAEDLVKVTEF